MAGFTVDIPEDVAGALKLPPAERELKIELALALYGRGALSGAKARQLAGLTRWEFEELLGRRKVPRPHAEDDLAEDLAHAGGSR